MEKAELIGVWDWRGRIYCRGAADIDGEMSRTRHGWWRSRKMGKAAGFCADGFDDGRL